MAQDIIVRTWCDPCLAEDEHREGSPYPLANGYVVDVCEIHRKPLDDIAAHARKDATATAAGVLTCPDCGKTLRSERGMRKHRSQQHPGSAHEQPATLPLNVATTGEACPDCGRGFSSAQGVSMHRFRAHGIRSENPDAVRRRADQQRQTESA